MAEHNRRLFVKGLASALALGSAGTAGGHPSDDDTHDIHRHDVTENAELVGFHTLGGVGSESLSGQPDNPLYGMVSETWLEGDLAFVSIQTSSEPTGNRGVAILEVSDYTRADSREELEDAEMTVLAFIGNESEAGTGNDVKVSDDGQYLFYSKQAIGADYGEPASASTDTHAAPGPTVMGVEAYDISDPGNPEYLGTATGPNVGFHNCFTHRIGGDHYVFGVQGAGPGSAGVHVFRLNEDGGGLEPVNFWGGDDLPVTDYGTDAAGYVVGYYCHDFYAHDDPVTGRPLGFIAYWNNGVRVIDLSDPRDIEELGFGMMDRAHYAQPAPALVDGKRVFVGSQEHSSQTEEVSGWVKLFDGDDLFEDGLTECEELASWTLYGNVSYDGYAFSPHNSDITADGWITQGHYHAGVRFLKIQPPEESPTGDWHIAGKRVRNGVSESVETQDPEPITTLLEEREITRKEEGEVVEAAQAYYRSHVEVPPESKTEGTMSPNFWSARIENGVTFGASEHTGFYAIAADPIEVGTRTPVDIDVTRRDDGVAFTGGQTNHLIYEIDTDTAVIVRDRLPQDWTVVGGDAHRTMDVGDGNRVVFANPVGPGEATRELFVDVGDAGGDQVGPVRYSPEDDPSAGGKDWEPVPGTVDANLVGPAQQ